MIYNERRYHKIEPLIRDKKVILIRGIKDILQAATLENPARKSSGVMIDSYGQYAILGLLARWLLRAKFIVRIRGSMLEESRDRIRNADSTLEKLRLRVGEWLIRRCFQTCDAIVYNSKHVRRKLKPFVSDDACEGVVYNPFTEGARDEATSDADLPSAGLRLLTVTNMDFEAKVNPTLKAMTRWMDPQLWEKHDIQWVILGDGKNITRLRDAVRNYGLEGRVSVPGWVENPFRYYDWCDVYVHMTGLDAFPNATMEAMSRFCPVLTNEDSCGVREQVIDGENGYLVGSKREFQRRLEEYATHPERRKKHGQAGKRLVETNWTVEHQRERMNNLLGQLEALEDS